MWWLIGVVDLLIWNFGKIGSVKKEVEWLAVIAVESVENTEVVDEVDDMIYARKGDLAFIVTYIVECVHLSILLVEVTW